MNKTSDRTLVDALTPSRRTVLAGGAASVALAPLPLGAATSGRVWPAPGTCLTLSFDVASGAHAADAVAVCQPIS